MENRKSRSFHVSIIILLVACVFLFMMSARFCRYYHREKRLREATASLQQVEHAAGRTEMNALGWDFSFVDSVIFEDMQARDVVGLPSNEKTYTTIILLAGIGCNLCAGEALEMLIELHGIHPPHVDFIAVLESDDLHYLKRFVRYNQVSFPVMVDRESIIMRRLQLDRDPVVLVVDNHTKKVIGAYVPTQELKYRTDAFRRFLLRIAT